MADDILKLGIEIEAEQAKKSLSSITSSIRQTYATFDKLSKLRDPLKGIKFDKGIKSSLSLKGFAKSLKEATNPLEIINSKMDELSKRYNEIMSKSKSGTVEGLLLNDLNDLAVLNKDMQKLQNAGKKFLNEYTQSLQNQQSAYRDLQMILDPVKAKLGDLNDKLAIASKNFVDLRSSGKDTSGVERNIKKIQKEMSKLENSTKKTSNSWQVLLGRIKNIAIYRSIRTAFHWLTSGIQEGVDNLVQYDKTANETMSNLNASVTQIKNTMGVAFMSVLNALQPVITTLANSLVDLINSFNLAMAKMKGENVYIKAKKSVDDYAASLKKAQKFSFDVFEVLSGGDAGKTQPSNMFEEANVEEDANSFSDTLGKVLTIIKQIFDVVGKIIKLLADSGILDAVLSVAEALLGIVSVILDLLSPAIVSIMQIVASVVNQIAAAFKVIAGLLKLLTGDFKGAWEYIGSGFANLVNGIVNMFLGVVNFIIDAINLLFIKLNPLFWILEAFGVHAEIPHIDWQMNWQPFADGGFTTANFIATNENGKREWVGRNAGATAVVNDTQMSDIMYQAVRQGCYEAIMQASYENVAGGSGESTITLEVDKTVLGKVVAQSAGFKSEATRIGLI